MNFFYNYHPFILLIYFLLLLLVIMFSFNPFFSVAALIGGALFAFTISSYNKKAKSFFGFLFVFFVITFLNPVFSHNGATCLFFINNMPITFESLIYGAVLAVTFISVILWCDLFFKIFDSEKLVFVFGKLFPKLSLIISIVLRYIPRLKKQYKKINEAQSALKINSKLGIVGKIRSLFKETVTLIGWSVEKAVETGKSMRARGYGLKKRSSYSNYKFTFNDLFFLILMFVSYGITLSGIFLKKVNITFYPVINFDFSEKFTFVTYVSFLIFAFLPFIIEIMGDLKWKYYKSKI